MADPVHILVAEARFYDDVADELLQGAQAVLDEAGVTYETVAVPGAYELPAAVRMAVESGRIPGNSVIVSDAKSGEQFRTEHSQEAARVAN